jgi:hypothetical protein
MWRMAVSGAGVIEDVAQGIAEVGAEHGEADGEARRSPATAQRTYSAADSDSMRPQDG